ncbi:hypothetical protein K7I13_12880 [Brucepastera parasyntrophica]|uniref:hypothetical protein n=1 Tax=Brucepastera parasyntrophica TaxID=2880008 RepID=UPI00210F1BFA|nr:hypothetical protein [Brucepastera parasyntrophica]ULQ59361.1 hypothetical protein K7I13_12880 [Brucepastera parasyntrophica]
MKRIFFAGLILSILFFSSCQTDSKLTLKQFRTTYNVNAKTFGAQEISQISVINDGTEDFLIQELNDIFTAIIYFEKPVSQQKISFINLLIALGKNEQESDTLWNILYAVVSTVEQNLEPEEIVRFCNDEIIYMEPGRKVESANGNIYSGTELFGTVFILIELK